MDELAGSRSGYDRDFGRPGISAGYNHVGGDQISQYGDYNVGKVENHQQTDDYRPAVDELRAFILELKASGIVSVKGEIIDPEQLEQAVVTRRSRLGKVSQALATGARSLITKAVDTAATPVILYFVDKLLK